MSLTCSSDARVYVGAVGKVIKFDLCASLLTATLLELHVKKPSGTIVIWTGGVDPTNENVIRYVTQPGDLDEVGPYLIQPYVEMPGLLEHARTATLTIYAEFE